MANNLGVKTGTDATIKTTDNSSVHTPHHNIEIASVAPAVGTGTRSPSTLRVTQATDDIDVGAGTGGSKTQRVILDSSQAATTYTTAQPMASAFQLVGLPTDGDATVSLALIDDIIKSDDAAFTPGTTKVAMAGFTFDDVATDSVDEGDAGAARMSANRNIYTTLRDAAGNERGLNVDANGAIATVSAGNVAAAATDLGNPIKVGAKYNSTKPTYTDGQRGDLQIGTRGALMTQLSVSDSSLTIGGVNPSGDGNGSVDRSLAVWSQTALLGTGGANFDRARCVVNATNSTGTGIAAVGLVGQLDDTSPTAITENQFGNVRMSADRALYVAQLPSALNGWSYNHIAAGQATTTVKSGAGTLHAIVLNSAATATNVTTVYDNTAGSGPVIAIPAVTTATVPTTLIFDIAFGAGLTIVTATANGGDMTICYK